LRVLDCKRETCKKEVEDLNIKEDYLCKDCLDNFKRILSLLDDLEINYIYTSALVRGLDYYTHTVFEVVSKKLGSQDALGAGGRYNHLIKDLGGPEIGAIGFALGIERILLVLEEKEKIRDTEVFVAAMPQFREDGFKLLQRLREENISSEIDYCDKSLKGQLRVAQKKKCRFVLILGEEEKKERVITLKDMQKSIQKKISERDLVKVLKGYLKVC
ncbi:MAG TPA: histidine--tRNA ligase, partial [Candidatus Omnitrophica bacterium]|nr:histidine--tRNA ligase [Candidatus Omnitrophota bacterium]